MRVDSHHIHGGQGEWRCSGKAVSRNLGLGFGESDPAQAVLAWLLQRMEILTPVNAFSLAYPSVSVLQILIYEAYIYIYTHIMGALYFSASVSRLNSSTATDCRRVDIKTRRCLKPTTKDKGTCKASRVPPLQAHGSEQRRQNPDGSSLGPAALTCFPKAPGSLDQEVPQVVKERGVRLLPDEVIYC